jgi:hypothetical protein
MLELIAAFILLISFLGIGIIIYNKLPRFSEMPVVEPVHLNRKNRLAKIKNLFPFKNFSSDIFLQKILSKIRILTLKTDNKTSNLLQRLREKALRKKVKEKENSDYWEKVKDFTKK